MFLPPRVRGALTRPRTPSTRGGPVVQTTKGTGLAVRISLKKMGRKHINAFRICVMDTRTAREGSEIEVIGAYRPDAPDRIQALKVEAERARYWMGVGAKPSLTVRQLFKKAGIPVPVKQRKSKKKAAKPPADAAKA